MISINLNCDMAEGHGIYQIGNDAQLLEVVNSANIACGFHGGDPTIMRSFAAQAKEAGVSLGAHPGFPDLQGFGRRRMHMAPAEVEAMVAYQIGALQAIAHTVGATVTHVKPHGALANMSAEDYTLAEAIARAIRGVDAKLIYVVLHGSQQQRAAEALGLAHAREGYADRLYGDDGNLAPRHLPNAVFHCAERALEQAARMVFDRQVVTASGAVLDVQIDTLCVHGDGPGALEIARSLRDGLRIRGGELKPLDQLQLPNTQTVEWRESA